jgi:hypothetical protein
VKRYLVAMAVAAAVALGHLPTSTAQDDATAFRDLSGGADFRVRVAAALALGRSHSPGARNALEKALSDPHPAVRAAASAALGNLGDVSAVPALQAALAREQTTSVKSQFETTIKKLTSSGAAPSGRAKFLVALGRIDVRMGTYSPTTLKAATRSRMSQMPGVEVVADGSDVSAISASRPLPAFTVDGTLTKLAKAQSGGGVSISARVEYLLRKMPDHAIKATMAGSAQADADAREIRGARELDQLQSDAVTAAIDSAFKGAQSALEAGAK